MEKLLLLEMWYVLLILLKGESNLKSTKEEVVDTPKSVTKI